MRHLGSNHVAAPLSRRLRMDPSAHRFTLVTRHKAAKGKLTTGQISTVVGVVPLTLANVERWGLRRTLK